MKQDSKELLNIFIEGDLMTCHKASWPLGIVVKSKPELLEPYKKRLIYKLDDYTHDSYKRNTLRIFQDHKIPKNLQGKAADICFRFLEDHGQAIAVKVFAMTVLFNICKEEPDLSNELKLLIEEQMPESSPGFRSRGRKILKSIEKLQKVQA